MTVDNIPQGEPRGIIFSVMTLQTSLAAISRGESPRLRTGLSVVRGEFVLGRILPFQERVQKAEMDFLPEELREK